jgi:L-methionine (R)-S-oxide reductase
MHQTAAIVAADKPAFYRELAIQLGALLDGERDPIAATANAAALLYEIVPDLNWAGFYFIRPDGSLVLGPFQGKPACTRIAPGRGVCGAAVAERRSVLVTDVLSFPGHIACDHASRSELVTPLFAGPAILGVLDLDSPTPARFDADDQAGMTELAAIVAAAADWSV